jgi:cyanate permease
MGFQFQSVPALALPMSTTGDLSFTSIGTLTGVYLLPGALIALGGGWIARRLGDARLAFLGLVLMTIGGFAGWWSSNFETAVFWRLVAGAGAVALNVMATKMAADWFEGRADLPAAMGVLVSSWPAGIALAMLTLPWVARARSLDFALLMPVLLCAGGFLLLLLVWRAPPGRQEQVAADGAHGFQGRELLLVVLAGSVWGIYNAAYVGIIAWAPGVLQAAGQSDVEATAAVSVIGWASILSVAAGGFILARVRWKTMLAVSSFLISAAAVLILPSLGAAGASVLLTVPLGIALGLPAAFVMTLPVIASRPQVRAMAMGIYFAIYYVAMGVAPSLLGALRDVTGQTAAPLVAAAGFLVYSIVATVLFRQLRPESG